MLSYERQRLKELEALRPNFKDADAKFIAATPRPKRPAYIPGLDDDLKPAPPPIKTQQPATPQRPPVVPAAAFRPPHLAPTPPSKSPNPKPASALPPQSPGAGPSTPSTPQFSGRSSPAIAPQQGGGPPLGGKFVDGSKSMFISPSKAGITSSPRIAINAQSPATPSVGGSTASSPAVQTVPNSPLAGKGNAAQFTAKAGQVYREADPLGPLGPTAQVRRTLTSNSFAPPIGQSASSEDVDPLGLGKPKYMSQSMQLPPKPRVPRLSAREAASKLANF